MKLQTRSGKTVHPIGIGTWGFGGTWEAVYDHDSEAISTIEYALSKGQNHIDSGQIYGGGHTDEIIGQAIEGFNRQDIYLTNKIWETSVASGKVQPAVETMLKKLGTDYLDALYIHKPWEDFPWREAVPQINDLIDKGIVRHFGVSNCSLSQTKEAARLSSHPITLSQLHFNVLNKDNLDDALKTFCKRNSIRIIAAKPLEKGAVLNLEIVQAIARSHAATAAQIALAWLLVQEIFPIPMTTRKAYIDQNLTALDIRFSSEEIAQLSNL